MSSKHLIEVIEGLTEDGRIAYGVVVRSAPDLLRLAIELGVPLSRRMSLENIVTSVESAYYAILARALYRKVTRRVF